MWETIVNVWAWLGTWLHDHEWLAIWLEGIALILLFGLERRQFRHERKKYEQSNQETLAQLEIAKQQAEAARRTAESIANSERAWLTASLEWSITNPAAWIVTSQAEPFVTDAALQLKIRNDGKTPAWIETIRPRMEICGHDKQPDGFLTSWIEPLVPGSVTTVRLSLSCPGKPKVFVGGDQLCVHIVVNYRDIFETRSMELEFAIDTFSRHISTMQKVTLDFRLGGNVVS